MTERTDKVLREVYLPLVLGWETTIPVIASFGDSTTAIAGAVRERRKGSTMTSRFCRWLIVSALLITASGARAQRSAPQAFDQKEQRVNLCSAPTALDQKSVTAFEQGATSGDAAAQCGMGMMYSLGRGVPQDYTQAAFWFRKAGEQGNIEAQFMLGSAYYMGQGVPQDFTQAAAWERKAAEQGHASAQCGLGDLYYHGQGLPQDYAQAAFWFRKAAEQGDAASQFMLGFLYHKGQGLPQDDVKAALWYRRAAEQGYARAQSSLGMLYDQGHGVPQDYAESYFWLNLAAAGTQEASLAKATENYRDAIASHLTPADLSREQERARKWFEEHQAKPQ